MTPKKVLAYFGGTTYKFWKATKMSPTSLRNWLIWGYVPEASQYKLERLTKGQLKTQWSK